LSIFKERATNRQVASYQYDQNHHVCVSLCFIILTDGSVPLLIVVVIVVVVVVVVVGTVVVDWRLPTK
jgi:hypothetical protein